MSQPRGLSAGVTEPSPGSTAPAGKDGKGRFELVADPCCDGDEDVNAEAREWERKATDPAYVPKLNGKYLKELEA
eukprot:5378553-Alexandrium_andersonii.AAC.1